MAKILAAATPKLAAADISENPNLAAARDMLERLGLIELNDEGAFLTDTGNEIMVNQNLATPDGQLTDDGMEAAHGKDAPPGDAGPGAPIPEPDLDLGMDLDADPDLEMGLDADADSKDNDELEMGMEGFSMIKDLRLRVIEESLAANVAIPKDLLRQLSREERVSLFNVLGGHADFNDDKDLFSKLYDYFVQEMPYGVAKARTGDPDEWIYNRLTNGPSDQLEDEV